MWSQIIGHGRQVEQIRRAISKGRLPNAYLFSGPKGVGKKLTADTLALAIACLGSGDEPCGNCAGCQKAMMGNHPDLIVVEADGETIKVEQTRKLQAQLKYHPLEAPSKLTIVDEADRMNESAANSMLKIIEEPPADTHFVLVTAFPHRLPATIRSRCQTISFSPIPDDDVSALLARRAGLSGSTALKIAKISGGSVGTALALDPDFVDDVIGRFSTLVARGSSSDIIEASQAWARSSVDQQVLIFDLLAGWYRDILRYKTFGRADSLAHADAARAADEITESRAMTYLAEIAAARAAADRNANKQLMFENLLFTLTANT
jgi:DNA polymerase III subunit delta'